MRIYLHKRVETGQQLQAIYGNEAKLTCHGYREYVREKSIRDVLILEERNEDRAQDYAVNEIEKRKRI